MARLRIRRRYRIAIDYVASSYRTESEWKNQFEAHRVDVNSVDPTNGHGIQGIDRVREVSRTRHWTEELDSSALICIGITSRPSVDANSGELRQVFRDLRLICKQLCTTEHMIDNLWLRDQSDPRIAWEKNTNRH